MFTSGYVNTETILYFFNTTTAECYPLILAQREEGRLNNEIRRINNEIKDLTEKRNIIEVRRLFTVYFFFFLLCLSVAVSHVQFVNFCPPEQYFQEHTEAGRS